MWYNIKNADFSIDVSYTCVLDGGSFNQHTLTHYLTVSVEISCEIPTAVFRFVRKLIRTRVSLVNPFRYRGEYFDVESGYTYLRARYYDSSVGRFINEDPICDGDNWYAYCNGNPIMYVDPSGLASFKNTISGNNVTTTVTVLWTMLTYKYTVENNGIIRFDFSKNNYWSVLWRGGAKTLAEAQFKASRTINKNGLQGRTIGGINTEMQLHWVAYELNIARESSKIADMGGMWGTGYDSNEFISVLDFKQILRSVNIAFNAVFIRFFGLFPPIRNNRFTFCDKSVTAAFNFRRDCFVFVRFTHSTNKSASNQRENVSFSFRKRANVNIRNLGS